MAVRPKLMEHPARASSAAFFDGEIAFQNHIFYNVIINFYGQPRNRPRDGFAPALRFWNGGEPDEL